MEAISEMRSFFVEREIAPRYDGERSVTVSVYCAGHGPFSIDFGDSASGLSSSIWTTRKGIEALRSACNIALVRSEA